MRLQTRLSVCHNVIGLSPPMSSVTVLCDTSVVLVPPPNICPFISVPIVGFVQSDIFGSQTLNGCQSPTAWQTKKIFCGTRVVQIALPSFVYSFPFSAS